MLWRLLTCSRRGPPVPTRRDGSRRSCTSTARWRGRRAGSSGSRGSQVPPAASPRCSTARRRSGAAALCPQSPPILTRVCTVWAAFGSVYPPCARVSSRSGVFPPNRGETGRFWCCCERFCGHFPGSRPGKRAAPGDTAGFADCAPYHLISEGSLADLTARLPAGGAVERPVSVKRFRPNVVVGGVAAYQEDLASTVHVGAGGGVGGVGGSGRLATFRNLGLSGRCVIPTTDPTTGERDRDE